MFIRLKKSTTTLHLNNWSDNEDEDIVAVRFAATVNDCTKTAGYIHCKKEPSKLL